MIIKSYQNDWKLPIRKRERERDKKEWQIEKGLQDNKNSVHMHVFEEQV